MDPCGQDNVKIIELSLADRIQTKQIHGLQDAGIDVLSGVEDVLEVHGFQNGVSHHYIDIKLNDGSGSKARITGEQSFLLDLSKKRSRKFDAKIDIMFQFQTFS